MAIEFVPYAAIDIQKWDTCIRESANGLLYASSAYLNHMSENWDALILDDYKAVMPLTWKKKYGIYYLYQPFFTASLGVFGNQLTPEMVNDFLQAIPARYRYADIYLNQGNFFTLKNFNLYQRVNYVLPLDTPYEKIYEGFKDNIKRNIKKAAKLNCSIATDIEVDEVIQLAKMQSGGFEKLTAKDFERFKKLYHYLRNQHQACTYGVYSPAKELMASCVFFTDEKRAYYILVGNHPNGKTIGASHALINACIKNLSAKKLLLDFEGSDIPSLAFFYSSFGAKPVNYPGYRFNKLPKLIRMFKK